ncbi:MAG TPA: phosphoribosylanthranilate isomerase [Phycisphaerae bacterium]|nr:phosphoribosylanthranilate isomerase [Phycisphaerae bacterium]
MSPDRVRVKICGITTPDDARLAADAGADAIGLNFIAGPRKIDPATARTILDALPPEVEAWALCDVSAHELPQPLQHLADAGHLTAGAHLAAGAHRAAGTHLAAGGRTVRVQMYGRILPLTVARLHDYGLRTVAVRRVGQAVQMCATTAWLDQFADAPPSLLLFDTASDDKKQLGGTGRTWPWDLLAEARRGGYTTDWPPIVLAGGLNPENVADAIRAVTPTSRITPDGTIEPLPPIPPAWVDVAGGVEQSPTQKHPAKLHAFINAVRSVAF